MEGECKERIIPNLQLLEIFSINEFSRYLLWLVFPFHFLPSCYPNSVNFCVKFLKSSGNKILTLNMLFFHKLHHICIVFANCNWLRSSLWRKTDVWRWTIITMNVDCKIIFQLRNRSLFGLPKGPLALYVCSLREY